MELMEISEKRKMSREEAAKLLHSIADSLARHNKLEFQRQGINVRVDVAKQVEVEIEMEVETDQCSLEIEINW
jgi:amphi-Trp domain-containing protein